ncbi:hypothetical protein MGU_10655 [Metarhizium guizhouense ARSEF 977]|uniref:FluG domain-containing protein n=1 Tax=Metarhizium guizhouense (strain ARSEF 977) TaxID=1276136 RepID=A0A0B4GWW8_METGA|nr:hypothetical protein MGU_10655 [Metarhizium guizhouense ARSEF 977]
MSRYVDPRAPTNATHLDLENIKTDPTLVKLIELRDSLSQEVRRESGSIRDAEVRGTKLYQMYRTVENKVRSTRAYLRKMAKAATRQDFFNNISTIEINSQLKDETGSFLDLGPDAWDPQPSYNLKERRLLADLICADTGNLNDETKLKHRIYTTNAMILLGREREIRRVKFEVKAQTDEFPRSCDTDQCFICFWDECAPMSQRLNKFCSPYRARDHLISRHLKGLGELAVICPEPRCRDKKATFHELQAFQAHLARVHSYDNFNRYKGLGNM